MEEVECVDGVVRGGAGAGAILFLCHTGAWPLRSAPQPPHCAVVPPLVTTHHTVIHGAELLGGPTVSTPDTITKYILYLFQLLPWRMKKLL